MAGSAGCGAAGSVALPGDGERPRAREVNVLELAGGGQVGVRPHH